MALSVPLFSLSSVRSSEIRVADSASSEIGQLARTVFETPLPEIASRDLKQRVSDLKDEDLLQFLHFMAQEIANASEPREWLEKLFQLIPEKNLSAACNFDGSKESTEALLQTARRFLDIIQKKPPSSWKIYWEAFLDVCVSVLETFVCAFGLEGFFNPAESKIDGDMKGSRIMQLTALSGMLASMLAPFLEPSRAASVVGWTIFTATSLSIVFPYIRPRPSRLLLARNWTKEIREGRLVPPTGRKKILNQVSYALISPGGTKALPMLVGQTGAGKTAIAQAFVSAVERGEYPELKGKTLFYYNTGDLKGTDTFTGRSQILRDIESGLGKHAKDVILIFDEIHQACKETQGSAGNLGEQLKTRLDPQSSAFPLVIGITTEEEFFRDIYREHPAFARRF